MRAVGSGRWDRSLSAARRRESQRADILQATARVLAGGGAPTVTQIVEAARVGRNTFYEHFEDAEDAVEEALDESRSRVLAAIDGAASASPTPLDRVRGIARAWLGAVLADPGLTAALLERGGAPSVVRAKLVGDLTRRLSAVILDARAKGAVSLGPDALRLSCAVSAFEGAALVLLRSEDPSTQAPAGHAARRPSAGAEGGTSASAGALPRAAEVLADVAIRIFR
jgi:AcrR family transcriptional regulator